MRDIILSSDRREENVSAAVHLQNADTWKRGGFMVFFIIVYTGAEVLIWGIALFQFGARLFTGETNPRLIDFGRSLSTYIYQILRFVSFNSEERPYPFSDWPSGAPR